MRDIRIFLIFVANTDRNENNYASVLGGRYTNASEVIRAGLRRLEEDEQKIAALRAAIEDGEASGYVEDFNFESHLEELKAKRRSNG